MSTFFTWLYGIIMILTGVNHFIQPNLYKNFIPGWMPRLAVNYLVGLIEISIGIGLLLPAYRPAAAIALLVLMIIFLPLHLFDIFKESPAIGSKLMAYIRLPLQFLLIFWAWYISRI